MHVARLLLLSAFCCSLFAATPKPQRSSQEIVAPFWTLEPGWHTSLEIRNNNATDVIAVTPVLRTNEGREVTLPVVSLHPDEARTLDLQQIVDSSQVRIPENPYGSLTLRYSAFSLRNIYAATMVHMPGHPIGFHFDAVGAYGKGSVRDFEGLWWLPTEASTAYLFITNSTDKPVRASLGFSSSAGIMNDQMLPLGPRQTRRISVRELVQRHKLAGTYGGIGVHLISDEGAVQVTQFVFDETIGFSAVLRMFEHFENAGAPRFPLRAPMVALSRPDPALNFPADTELQSRIFLRNTTAKAVLPTVIVHWRTSGEQGSVPINASELSANEVRLLDLSALQRSGRIPADASWANVEISHSGRVGDVIAIAASYDSSLRYGTQTPFTRIVSSFWKGSLWRVDGTHASFITAGNSGDTPVAANVALISPDGKFRYELPEHTLAPDEQIWVDVRDLIRNRIPDRNGKVLPADMTTGTYEIWESKFSAVGQLFEGKLIIDKTYGHATYGCGSCCGLWQTLQELDPFTTFVGGSNQQIARGQNSCTGNWQTINAYSWFSYDNTVADVGEGGLITAYAPGSTTIESRSETLSPYPSCEPYEILQYAQVDVHPSIISPNHVLWYFTGQNPDSNSYPISISLTSTGGSSTTWSVTAGSSRVHLSSTSGASISITPTGSHFSGTLNDVAIVANAGGFDSDPFYITVRTPWKLVQRNPYAAENCFTNANVQYYSSSLLYDVHDNFDQTISADIYWNEHLGTFTSENGSNWGSYPFVGQGGSTNPLEDILQPPIVAQASPTQHCLNGAGGTTRYRSVSQTIRVGSSIDGQGTLAQTDLLGYYIDHGQHDSVSTPSQPPQ